MVNGFSLLHSKIVSNALNFTRKFRCASCTDDYLFYEFLNQFAYNSVVIIKTSSRCYRLVYYSSLMSGSRKSEYKSFRNISDMCFYLDSICPSAFENK